MLDHVLWARLLIACVQRGDSNQQAMESATALHGEYLRKWGREPSTLQYLTDRIVMDAIEKHGNKKDAAKALGISRFTLYRRQARQRMRDEAHERQTPRKGTK